MASVAKITPQDPMPTPITANHEAQSPYPVDALGSVLAPAVKALAEGVQVPLSLAAQSVLSAAAFAAQPHADVIVSGRRVPISLFMLSVAESGDRKSAVDKFATLPARERQDRLREDYREQRQWYRNEKIAYDEACKHVLATNKSAPRDELKELLNAVGLDPQPPKEPRILSSEPTAEGLQKAFARGWKSQGLFSDEGGSFFGGGAMADSKLKTIALLSQFWGGDQSDRTRATEGESLTINNPRLSAHLMIQPVVANKVLNDPEMLGQGFLARFLIAAPESLAGTRFYKDINLSINADIKRFQSRLTDLFEMDQPEDEYGNLSPRELALSNEAHMEYTETYDAIEKEIGRLGSFRDIKATGSKAAEQALRIAGVLALVENPLATIISGETMRRAADLSAWYLLEVLRLTNKVEETEEQKLGRKLVRKMIEAGWKAIYPFKAKQYIRGIASAQDAEKVIENLEERGWLIKLPNGTEVDGSKRKQSWRLNNNASIKALG